jgi:isoleucyl-tRNA synthetase
MRCSEEILQRVSDAYRKMRNTARFALGNLDGFDPARDRIGAAELLEIDRWALGELDALTERVREAYEGDHTPLVRLIGLSRGHALLR